MKSFLLKDFTLFIYLFESERVQVSREGAEGEGQADSPLSMEPKSGPDLTTLRSGPERNQESDALTD